jgi:hypothetical protein
MIFSWYILLRKIFQKIWAMVLNMTNGSKISKKMSKEMVSMGNNSVKIP